MQSDRQSSMATKPKHPRTSYNFFFLHTRGDIQREIFDRTGKTGSYTEIANLVAGRWKQLDPMGKAYFRHLAAEDKQRYAIEILRWEMREQQEVGVASVAQGALLTVFAGENAPHESPGHCTPDRSTKDANVRGVMVRQLITLLDS